MTRKEVVAERLFESKMECLKEEKDCYLYYLLYKFKGKTLVFVNTIGSIKHVLTMLSLLEVEAWGLHAQMEQRQRLKNLDRFRDCENGVLVATDVAARGLDIPSVNHIVHYHIPNNPEVQTRTMKMFLLIPF